ncbi:FkbM family methyltransferase [Jiella sonneratiae]|uniref:FkbM family methyltransferase n=1 Tax=Jiella sonneratiae TaxID=2816856 RepID=A0ABS3J1X8_9HYPH|nr:FkbM family methyltransferase [Jiella sonneratiae]MBO0902978.1 FkbM family methyltransferase [Jiella sonneratiae]
MRTSRDDAGLVMDLGANNGDDTAYYLAKGFRVVALEANAGLAASCRERFAAAIAAGRVVVEEAAIWRTDGEVTFLVNEANDHWSSIEPGWAGREASATRPVTVEAVTLATLVGRHGVPHYLKIDVEGVDGIVLDQLAALSETPAYVSVEDCRFGFDYIATLSRAGYDRFKLLDQSEVPSLVDEAVPHRFLPGASGPFGEEVPGPWSDTDAFVALYARTVRDRAGNRLAPRSRWWDIHAAKS